jgi:hypothetical protein
MERYTLPDLPYDYAALEPHYAARTLELHHGKHHAAYVAGANATLEKLADARRTGDFATINQLQKNLAFHLSGHVLHSLFWRNMSPRGGGEPDGELAAADQKLAEEHLTACWTCRDRQNQLQGTIRQFLSFRDTLRPVDFAPGQAPVEQFRQRLARHAQEQDTRRPLWSGVWEVFRGTAGMIASHRQAALALVVVVGVLFATFTDVLTSTGNQRPCGASHALS